MDMPGPSNAKPGTDKCNTQEGNIKQYTYQTNRCMIEDIPF